MKRNHGEGDDLKQIVQQLTSNMARLEQKYSEDIAVLEQKIATLEQNKQVASSAPAKRFVLFLASGNLDKVFSGLMIVTLAASAGYECRVCCSLWSLNLIRKTTILKDNTLMQKMAKLMMKKGPENAILSQMHMFGLGTLFMKKLLKDSNISSLEDLLQTAIDMGVQVCACDLMMQVMGVKKEELRDDVKVASGMEFMQMMSESSINMIV
jgi:peroxiredoxin family protein